MPPICDAFAISARQFFAMESRQTRRCLGRQPGARPTRSSSAQKLSAHWAKPALRRETGKRFNRPGAATTPALERGALLIARRGTGHCIADACEQPRSALVLSGPRAEHERAASDYCHAHHAQATANRKCIERVFAEATAAYPRLEDHALLLTIAA
jgi:hypothetical protein